MSNQVYFFHTKKDIPNFLSVVYSSGATIINSAGISMSYEQAINDVIYNLMSVSADYQIVPVSPPGNDTLQAFSGIELTHPVYRNKDVLICREGRLYFQANNNSASYNTERLLFQRIKRHITKNYLYDKSNFHYFSKNFLHEYKAGNLKAIYLFGATTIISERVLAAVDSA